MGVGGGAGPRTAQHLRGRKPTSERRRTGSNGLLGVRPSVSLRRVPRAPHAMPDGAGYRPHRKGTPSICIEARRRSGRPHACASTVAPAAARAVLQWCSRTIDDAVRARLALQVRAVAHRHRICPRGRSRKDWWAQRQLFVRVEPAEAPPAPARCCSAKLSTGACWAAGSRGCDRSDSGAECQCPKHGDAAWPGQRRLRALWCRGAPPAAPHCASRAAGSRRWRHV